MAIVEAISIPIGVTGQETVNQAANSYEDLGDAVAKTQLEAEKLANTFGINDKRTQEAIKVAGRYKQEMEQLDFAIDGARGGVDTLFRATQGVVAGFEVAAGAAALFGGESEQLEKLLVKVQGAMVLGQGLKDIKEFGPAMKTAVKDTLSWVKSLRLARVALAGLGIGAIVIAFQAFKDQLGGIIDFFKDLSDSLGLTNFAAEELIKTQEKNIDVLNRELALMEAKGVSEDKLYAKRLEIAQAEEKLAQSRLAIIEQGAEGYDDAFKAAEDATNAVAVLTATENKRQTDAYKERVKAREEFNQMMFDLQFKELLDNKQRLKDIADLEKLYQAESRNDIVKNRLLRNIELSKQFKEERDMLDDAREMDLITQERYEELTLIQNDNHKKKLLQADTEYRQATRDLQEKSASELSQVLLDLNNVFQGQKEDQSRQEFERDKALNIAQTLISTYFAAQKAYTSQLTATPDSPIRAAIAAAAAITGGLARVASIRRVRYDDPNAGSAGSAANATGQAIPRFNAPTTRIPGQGDEFTQVRRIYVTERDITNVQDKVRVTEGLSQF
jgi:hypothetical protein